MDWSPTRRRYLRSLGLVAGATALSSTPVAAQEGPSATPDGYGPLGAVRIPGLKEATVAGDVAYVATTDGFATVDCSDPTDPTVLTRVTGLLADREGGPIRGIYDVKVSGDRLLVAGPAGGSSFAAVVRYDVSDPAAPEQLGALETDFFHHNVFLDGRYAYLTGNGLPDVPLVVLDTETMELVGRWSPVDHDSAWADVPFAAMNFHDVFVNDGVAYCAYWDAGTWLVDVSDPTAPSYLANVRSGDPAELAGLSGSALQRAQLEPPGNDHYVAVDDSGTLVGVGGESWDLNPTDDTGGPSGIELFDVSDPTAPVSLTTIAPPETDDPTYGGTWTTAHNFDLADGRLYSSWYAGGVRVYDLSAPSDPVLERAWRASDATSFWTAQAAGDYFVASSQPAGSRGGGGVEALFTFPADDRLPGSALPASIRTTTTTRQPTTTTVRATTTTTTPPPTTTAATTTTTSTTSPGFGVGSALVGLGAAAWLRLRRRED